MATRQDIESWMDETRESRRMIELFGDDDPVDLDLGGAEQGVDQGESFPKKSCKSVLTKGSSRSDSKPTKIKLLRQYPALMDPMNVLNLLARFSASDIVAWANTDQPEPITDSGLWSYVRQKVLELVGEVTPGGEPMLRKCIEVAKCHHRRDIRQNAWNKKGPGLIRKTVDEWYQTISRTTASDDVTLPLSYEATVTQRAVLKWSLGDSNIIPLSTLLRGLLRDPLFPYTGLEDTPSDVLVKMCTRYSYEHVLDMLKVNSPQLGLTGHDIRVHVEDLTLGSLRWVPTGDDAEDAAEQVSSSDSTLQKRCGHCIDNDIKLCLAKYRTRREPGQTCKLCERMGLSCEDRSVEDRSMFLTPDNFVARRKICGGMHESWEESRMGPDKVTAHKRMRELYALLHSCSERADMPASLRLPRLHPNELKLPSLVEAILDPRVKVEPVNYEGEDEDEDMEDLESLVVSCCERL